MQGGQRIPNYNFKDCIGLKVKPRKGDALLFWSIYPNGTIDPVSTIFSNVAVYCFLYDSAGMGIFYFMDLSSCSSCRMPIGAAAFLRLI